MIHTQSSCPSLYAEAFSRWDPLYWDQAFKPALNSGVRKDGRQDLLANDRNSTSHLLLRKVLSRRLISMWKLPVEKIQIFRLRVLWAPSICSWLKFTIQAWVPSQCFIHHICLLYCSNALRWLCYLNLCIIIEATVLVLRLTFHSVIILYCPSVYTICFGTFAVVNRKDMATHCFYAPLVLQIIVLYLSLTSNPLAISSNSKSPPALCSSASHLSTPSCCS